MRINNFESAAEFADFIGQINEPTKLSLVCDIVVPVNGVVINVEQKGRNCNCAVAINNDEKEKMLSWIARVNQACFDSYGAVDE